MKADIGLIGLAVMGENLALNIESKHYTVAVYNRNTELVDKFINGRGKGKSFIPAYSLQQLTDEIKLPRKILLMIKAGEAVDSVISQLVKYLSPGDVIIDGGNSNFQDTERRVAELEKSGVYYIGTGISGGEEGALHGPSIMPGGSAEAWPLVKNILESASAKLEDGSACTTWIGNGGSGHFVKMVHNGIEYGDMQLISEAYALMKNHLGMSTDAMADAFEEWNEGDLDSYLIDITSKILRYKDLDGSPLLPKILDVAGQKGTGKLSVLNAIDENEPLTLITEAVYARFLSSLYALRQKASFFYAEPMVVSHDITCDDISKALYISKIVSYAQGFALLQKASQTYDWELNLAEIAKIWRNGCIIRARFLEKITSAYSHNPDLENLLFDAYFIEKVKDSLNSWRKVVSIGALSGVALPAMSAALSYFDGLRTLHSAANMIQAQRDFFGAHTYERTDRERGHFFHTNWTGEGGDTVSGTYNV